MRARLRLSHSEPDARDGLIGYVAWLEPPPGRGPLRLAVGHTRSHCPTPGALAALCLGLELARVNFWRLVDVVGPWPTMTYATGYEPDQPQETKPAPVYQTGAGEDAAITPHLDTTRIAQNEHRN